MKNILKIAGFVVANVSVLSLVLLGPQSVNAALIFQDDTFATVESDAINIGSNNTTEVNTSMKFGNNATASENGNIVWNIAPNRFSADHPVDVTGDLTTTAGMTASGGVISFNNSSNFATNINTGTSTGAVSIGNSAAGALSLTTGAAFTLAGGAASTIYTTVGNISFQPAGAGTGNVVIGTGSGTGTPDLFVLDQKNTVGDPSIFAGGMYYNSNMAKFRCGENGAWKDCISGNPSVDYVDDGTITSPTPGTNPNFGTEIEILTPTNPTVTPDDNTQRFHITGGVEFVNPAAGDDTSAAVRVRVHRGSGNCTGTQVGGDFVGETSDPQQTIWIPFDVLDAPASAAAQTYTVCAAQRDGNGATATNATIGMVTIAVQEVAAAGA
jgi:hypothetical protein